MQTSKERSQNDMKKQTLGTMIASLRKEHGMTQIDLAERMGVTDKAVSKWERDLSYPDVNSLPKLAEAFGISVDELMQVKADSIEQSEKKEFSKFATLSLKGIALAMGVATTVLSILHEIDAQSAVGMLGIGLACLAIVSLQNKSE